MSFTRSEAPWRTILAALGALTGVCSVVGMLVGAVWTIGAISAGFQDLSRRMGLAETQLGALTHQVSGLREAMIRIEDRQPPARHAAAPAPAPAPDLYTESLAPAYRGGGMN